MTGLEALTFDGLAGEFTARQILFLVLEIGIGFAALWFLFSLIPTTSQPDDSDTRPEDFERMT